jgi:hypothetical protein
MKRKFINSDNHKFHQYQYNNYLSAKLNLSRRGRMVGEFTTTSSGTPRAFPQVKKQARI